MRLIIACYRSGEIGVFDTETGKELQALPIKNVVNYMAFDPTSKRIYVACDGAAGFQNRKPS